MSCGHNVASGFLFFFFVFAERIVTNTLIVSACPSAYDNATTIWTDFYETSHSGFFFKFVFTFRFSLRFYKNYKHFTFTSTYLCVIVVRNRAELCSL